MAVQIVFTPELFMALTTLIKSGIELIGEFTDEQLIQMAADQKIRSEQLQKRQEGKGE